MRVIFDDRLTGSDGRFTSTLAEYLEHPVQGNQYVPLQSAVNSIYLRMSEMGTDPMILTVGYESFSSPGPAPTGMAVHDGDLIIADAANDYLYVMSGITEEIKDSFLLPYTEMTGLTIHDGNLIICDAIDNKIYVMDGISPTLQGSFPSPGSSPSGLAVSDGNLIIADRDTDLVYRMDGISPTVQSSFDAPGIIPTGLAVSDGNLIIADITPSKIYVMDGISPTVQSSFDLLDINPKGLAVSNGNLFIADVFSSKIYVMDGISATEQTVTHTEAITPVDGVIDKFIITAANSAESSRIKYTAPAGAKVHRIMAGYCPYIGISPSRTAGFDSTYQPRRTAAGQVMPGAGGTSSRTLEVDVRYKIDTEVFSLIEAGHQNSFGRGKPVAVGFEGDELARLPWDALYATIEISPKFTSMTRQHLYSRKFEFREAF